MTQQDTKTVRITKELLDQLNKVKEKTGRSISYMVEQAIKEYLKKQ